MIFQDPYESLNPRSKIYDILAEPLIVNKAVETKDELDEKIMRKLEEVKLTPPDEFAFRYPHQLSGGQRQRVVIARGMILDPEFVVADEPVSMLDVSIRIDILNLLNSFREKYGVSYLYITHDLATARYIGDRIGIMYLGQIVETGPVEDVIQNPKHPYTQALISAIPIPDPEYARKKEIIELKGEIPSPINPPKGCRLHPRCPFAMDICSKKEPPVVEIEKGHKTSCWLYEKH
jgi:peptide/nickel transport system ATP-binding protein